MIGSAAKKSGVKTTALFAYAAGITGILANIFLIAFFALQAGNPQNGVFLGSVNDLIGSLGTALMIPVALALGASLPDRRLGAISRIVGLSAMAVLTVGGPLLVLGVLSFEAQAPIALGAWVVLSLWMFLTSRWSRLSGALRFRVARFGEILGSLVLAAGAVAGLALLLPWMPGPQMVLFGVAGFLAATGMLGMPFWFLLLGRRFSSQPSAISHQLPPVAES